MRIVAARGILVMAILCLLLFLGVFIWDLLRIYDRTNQLMWGRFAAPTLREYFLVFWYDPPHFSVFLGAILLLFIPGTLLTLSVRPVRAGRKIPSAVAAILLIPFVLFLVPFTAITFCVVFMRVFWSSGSPSYRYAPLFLLVVAAVFGILLLKDLCTFLLWIARNPTVEKPPTSFLPDTSHPSTNT